MTTQQHSIHRILERAREVIGPSSKPIALHEPCFAGNEWAYVKDCLDSGWVSSVGAYVTKFEQALTSYTGAKHAVATVNGTAALTICAAVVGVKRDDEVLLPALSFVATANAISFLGAIPHFVDSESHSLGVDPKALADYLTANGEIRGDQCFNRRSGRRIKALVAMHAFGHSVQLDALLEVCESFRLDLIEDAAESLGSFYKGRHTGNFGRVAALSFNGNKVVTTGGGGAVLTNDPELAARAKHLTTTAKQPHPWHFFHDEVGFNFRLPNLNAALGVAQMELLPDFVSRKRKLARRYADAFESLAEVRFVKEPEHCVSNYWLNTIVLENEACREDLLSAAHGQGLQLRPVWRLLSDLPMYGAHPRMDLGCARELERRLVNLPSSASLVSRDDQA